MAPTIVRLPDGQTFTVTPVFAGLFFKSNELNSHHNAFPAGWTVVLHTQDEAHGATSGSSSSHHEAVHDKSLSQALRSTHISAFTKPTLQNDCLFISSISNPSSSDFKPAASPTRQIAMMVWVSLYWYFHQPAPKPVLPTTTKSSATPIDGQPRGEWRINIKRDGVLRGKNLIPKLERMGLITSLDSAVGTNLGDGEGWDAMYVSKRMFWQMPARLFLFTLQPARHNGSFPGSPIGSRPGSPSPHSEHTPNLGATADMPSNGGSTPMTLVTAPSFPIGPFFSTSHLPTYYPPSPLQYTMSNGVRHPVRQKPPRMGEVFYTRFVHSVNQYLSFRVASVGTQPVPYFGPVGPRPPENSHTSMLSDTALLQTWLGNPRVNAFWGGYVPDFLTNALSARHSFPVIGMWDGVPFGYFEIYWVKEDTLGQHLGAGEAGDFDRGFHVLVGEEWARGRVQLWLSGLVHWILCADIRTMSVCTEPRVDNARFIQHLQYAGFTKDREVAFPHKQAWVGRLRRENWEGPAL